ncbi:BTAD domain-containing putative transcriptional regulator [Micromonospora sagamiensis]|uniref:DNA-binding SARP family transcriptional activator n=1 Tax=Micromonospora sagamiensis TaxID=47875 RepID=A0A562WNY0_9ACTN|nr:BTAD domain-containing putative transcriptional regulator [Micromonospora sagamiensis]TWJ31094.1 DNA-binding SARP family transcriptional activator [Micromonospora sagamiensis]BCL15863.1 XRE family transcriptional regulator [Micromonospora sagamiensis]
MADDGAELRLRRLRAGLTQEQLAHRAGISVRAVRDIEQGRVRAPRPESLRRIAEAIGPAVPEPPVPEPPAETGSLRIGVLGPLTLRVGAEPVNLGSGRQRMLLGLLALHPETTVSRQEIVDVLWGHDPPDSCLNLVHTYVARLRRALAHPGSGTSGGAGTNSGTSGGAGTGGGTTIVHAGGGYQLRVGPGQLDLARFTALIGRAEGSVAGDLSSLDRLAEALALWRGPVLTDLGPGLAQHPTAAALNRRRIATAVTYATLAVELGLPDRAVRELSAVAGHEPLHEQVHARLMLALAACGQQARALTLHRKLRDRLADQLGVEPGPELREAQLRILRQDLPVIVPRAGTTAATPPRPVEPATRRVPDHRPPAQLPADVAHFTGRSSQMAALDALLAASTGASGPVVVATITGMAGVGKTALAVHWAHRVRQHFPDGQLYVNLRGYSTANPVREGEALAGFLHALGVPAEQIPVDPGQAAALLRTLLDGRRMLLVLDNAASADQVRPLLPGTPGCLALVTSRDRLSGLVAIDGARRIALDVLTGAEASALLTRIIPADQVSAAPTEIAELAEVCARLPLALRIAAADLIDHPGRPIGAHTARLSAGNQLAGLRVEGDDQAAVRAAFDLSYAALPASTRRLFRLLGPAPGADVTVPAAAALAALDEVTAARELDRLAAAHLVQQPRPGRYTFHDLLRIYAVERATAEDPAPERVAANRRLYAWCRRRAEAAAAAIYPQMLRLPPAGDADGTAAGDAEGTATMFTDGTAAGFASAGEAMAWLEAERSNLVRVVAHAAEHGADPAAWRIPDALRGYYQFRPHSDGFVAATHALRAAQDAGDHAGEAASRLGLASLHLRRSEYRVGLEHATAMIEAATRTDWPEGLAAAHGTCGLMHLRAGRLAEAAEFTRRAVEIHERLGGAERLSTSLGNLGVIYRDMGRLREAEEVFRQGLALTRRTGMRMNTGISLSNLGDVEHALGRYDEALAHLGEALELSRETGYRPTEVESLRRLAALHVHAGDLSRAVGLADEALALAELVGDPAQQAAARNVLGTAYLRRGNDAAAVAEHRRALELARATGAHGEEAESLIGLAEVHRQTDPVEALAVAGHARDVARTAGYRVWEGHALVTTAEALRVDDPVAAARVAREALVVHRETGHLLGQLRVLRLLVALASGGVVTPAEQAAYRHEAEQLARLGRWRDEARSPRSG